MFSAKFTSDGKPVILARSGSVRFVVRFQIPCPEPFTRFEVVTLEAPMKVRGAPAITLANEINSQLTSGRAWAPSSDQIVLSVDLIVGGGVAANNFHRQVLDGSSRRRMIQGRPASRPQ
jgi:hypothetical protein